MKKSLMSNIKHFVDSNVRQRIDRASNNNNEFIGEDIILIEKHFEDIRHVCSKAGKTISALLQSTNSPSNIYSVQNVQASINNLSNLASVNHQQHQNSILSPSTATTSCSANTNIRNETSISHSSNQSTLTKSNKPNSQIGQDVIKNSANFQQNPLIDSNDSTSSDIRKHKKLPVVGFLKFLVKSCQKLKSDSLLHTTLLHCSQLQTQLTKLYLSYEQTVEIQCLRPIQQILEVDAPNVIKLRKLFIKSHNDLESVKAKYNGASQKQQQQQLQTGHLTSTSYTISQSAQQQANINKLDQLKKELDDAITRFEQARDTYATELYAFVCRETELVNLFMKFYEYQADYQQQVANAIQGSLPSLSNMLATTPRRVVFNTPLEEHLSCTGRNVALVIELCIHLLYSNALHEEGLFRIPGSSVKIKKLRNAINAWFVTLASQTELENDQQQQLAVGSQSPSLLAIYALFKDIVAQKKPLQTISIVENSVTSNNQSAITTPTATIGREDLTLTHTNLQSTTLSSYSQEPQHHQQQQQQFLVFDVHTIAGLLKLYLRESSEPLFTYALYDQWIDATVKTLNPPATSTATQSNSSEPIPSSSTTLKALEQVVEQLPKANYDNLRLLIRFLHILTCHQEFNRMTATNLAITMAPSLIWSKPTQSVQPPTGQEDNNTSTSGVVGEQTQMDEIHALNMQMSSVGISASLHALVIENLISHAEILFPGQMCFTLPGLDEQIQTNSATTTTNKVGLGGDDQKVVLSKLAASVQGRCIKSTSPTGLSTASSSSFSSTTSVTSSSATTTNKIKHSRKGGSMDGLLNDVNTNIASITLDNNNINNRPMSVHINQQQQQQHSSTQPKQFQQQPPPVPPAPAARSHSRQASESSTSSCTITNRPSGASHKQPAPVPPPCALKRQPKITASNDQLTDYRARALSKQQQATPPATGTSLRGTGIIAAPQPATRPNVPPPNRPELGKEKATSSSFEALDDNDTQQTENKSLSNKAAATTRYVTDNENNPNQGDNKSSNSVTSSGNLRADFEEINAADVDDIDSSAPISPIISLESISGDGDSSFDDDCPSLEHSWAECELERDGRNQAKGVRKNSGGFTKLEVVSSINDEDSRCETLKNQIKPAPRLQRKKNNLVNDSNTRNGVAGVEISTNVDHDDDIDNDDEEETLTAPPIKPPRSTSPKVTQSTPL